MATREDLHQTLVDIAGFNRVYFQPPAKLEYPCIIYKLEDYNVDYGNDKVYRYKKHYTVTLICKTPDIDAFTEEMFKLPYCSFDRRYINDNLYHNVFDIYW